MQYTEKVFSALSEQDFLQAQGFFRKEIKENPTYQAYNNLAMFYFENGIVCKNGRFLYGRGLAKRLLHKALMFGANAKVLCNLAMLEFETGLYSDAQKHLTEAYQMEPSSEILYHIAVLHFHRKEYRKAAELCTTLNDSIPESRYLYALSIAHIEKMDYETLLSRSGIATEEIDPMEQFDLLYLTSQYNDLICLFHKLCEDRYFLSDYQWLFLMNAFIETGKVDEGLSSIHECFSWFEGNPFLKEFKKTERMTRDENYRKSILDSVFFDIPFLDNTCPYFGCPTHKTSW